MILDGVRTTKAPAASIMQQETRSSRGRSVVVGMEDDGDSRRIPVPLPRRVGRRAAMLLLSPVGSVDKGVMRVRPSINRDGD